MTTRRLTQASSRATAAQTRFLAAHVRDVVDQLHAEIGAPERPHGRPALVMLMGLPGVGKSHVARILARRLGAAHVATDHLRSRLFIAASYTPDENRAVFAVAEALLDRLLDEGHRVVLDATNLVARNRAGATAVARRRAVPLIHVHVSAEVAAARARLAERGRARSPSDHSDADERVFDAMLARGYEAPLDEVIEVTSEAEVAEQLDRVVNAVERA